MKDELLQMKNLGKTTTQWLHAAGIHNAADLRRLGAIHAYQAIRTRGFRTSRTLLYAIEGALRDKDWLSLSASEKALLNQQLASPDK